MLREGGRKEGRKGGRERGKEGGRESEREKGKKAEVQNGQVPCERSNGTDIIQMLISKTHALSTAFHKVVQSTHSVCAH